MLSQIESSLEQLSRSERKVAAYVLGDAPAVLSMSIARVAQEASVSEPTVNRFCRTFGATGFPDFKLKLAQSLASSPMLTTAMALRQIPPIRARIAQARLDRCRAFA